MNEQPLKYWITKDDAMVIRRNNLKHVIAGERPALILFNDYPNKAIDERFEMSLDFADNPAAHDEASEAAQKIAEKYYNREKNNQEEKP